MTNNPSCQWTLALIRAAVAYDRAVDDVCAERITPETYRERLRELLEAAIGGMDTHPPETASPEYEYEWKLTPRMGILLHCRRFGSSGPWEVAP